MSSISEEEDQKPPAIGKTQQNVIEELNKKSQKKKKIINHENSWEEYCKFMNANLEKKKLYHESLHLFI